MNVRLLEEARDFALAGGGSGMIARSGKLVMSWGDTSLRYDVKSAAKSIGVTALGLALQDNLVALDGLAQHHLPSIGLPPQENAATGWLDEITILHLATHTAGFAKPGGYTELSFRPGTTWLYTDGGANWLADLLTVTYATDLRELLFSRVFANLGIQPSDLVWRNNRYREHTINGIPRREFGSGIRINVDAMARIGYLYLRNGEWEDARILPADFVTTASRPHSLVAGLPVVGAGDFPESSDHYGLLWWNNGDGALAGVPTDAFWAWGLFDSLIIVIPSLDIVVSRAGNGWRSGWDADYSVIEPFVSPIARSVESPPLVNRPPEVDAGEDVSIRLPADTVSLQAVVTDDGLPDGNLATRWEMVSGPAPVVFSDASATMTTVTFSRAGAYELRFTADDGELMSGDTLQVIVEARRVRTIMGCHFATLGPGLLGPGRRFCGRVLTLGAWR